MLTLLAERNLPALSPREQMLLILQDQVYGYLPPAPTNVTFEVTKGFIRNFCAGKATIDKVTAHCTIGDQSFSFPFHVTIPTGEDKYPFFIHINFQNAVAERYQPTEELVDNGFAVLSFYYKDITSDDGDFTNALAGVLYPDGVRKSSTDAGKLAMWAWAAHRVMDYAQTLTDSLDLEYGVVCGHSRLGKTALLTAATDSRFAFAYSNDSGCSGAAISRGTQGESVKAIYNRFPYWFCENYGAYMEKEEQMPFDQHFLVASIAPRKVLIGSADGDAWADPVHEQLCCFAASAAFPNGFVCPDRKAQIGEEFFEGDLGYHLRKGLHCFSREDWNKLIKFVNLKRDS
jgi:hypothetical protein